MLHQPGEAPKVCGICRAQRAKVMEAGRFKVMVNMSSDHAGIAAELKKLEREIYRVVAHLDDPRKLRDYLLEMRLDSASWCEDNGIDMRGWMDNGRYRKA